MKEEREETVENLAISTTVIINLLLLGFVLLKMWQWFIVPIFGVNAISYVEALGLIFFIACFKRTRKEKVTLDKTIYRLNYLLFILFIGFIIQLFM